MFVNVWYAGSFAHPYTNANANCNVQCTFNRCVYCTLYNQQLEVFVQFIHIQQNLLHWLVHSYPIVYDTDHYLSLEYVNKFCIQSIQQSHRDASTNSTIYAIHIYIYVAIVTGYRTCMRFGFVWIRINVCALKKNHQTIFQLSAITQRLKQLEAAVQQM